MYSVTLLVVAAVSVAAVGAICPGADKCFDKSAYSSVSKTNAKEYCVKCPRLIVNALLCFAECGASVTSDVDSARTETNDFCKNSDPKCTNVVDEFFNQTQCYNQYDGGQTATKSVIDRFQENFARNDDACQKVSWSRSCLKSSCSYNDQLGLEKQRDIADGFLASSICGSELVSAQAYQVEDNSQCTADIDTKVESDANIACQIATAESLDSVCNALENQAAYLQRITAGCAKAKRKYILPRMLTYAMANVHLKCKIDLRVRVYPVLRNQVKDGQETLQTQCNFATVLNSCLFARAYEAAIDWNRVKQLINRDLPIGDFCTNFPKKDSALSQCVQAAAPCIPPEYRLFSQSASYDDDYVSKLGPFAIDAYGLAGVFKTDPCAPGDGWTKGLCKPDLLEVVTPDTTKRPTQQPRTTQSPVKNPVGGNNNNVLDKDDFKGAVVEDEGSKLVVSFALFGFSVLMALITTM